MEILFSGRGWLLYDLNACIRKLWAVFRGCGRILSAALILMVIAGLQGVSCGAVELVGQEAQRIGGAPNFHLGPGDVISITVYGEEDLSRQHYRLPDSGLIMFPFGEVAASGLTISELESRIADGLRGGYLVNPRVSVSIEEYRPFFINGQVAQPGAYPYKSGLTVRMAVSIAGGFKERASESKIYVVRESDPTHQQVKISLDGEVFPGDAVTVEESFF
ncbi:MAG: polysaccharide export protein [Gallionella sp.]|nr:polysaccharide export protein [Gallionella sp.]